MLSLSVNVVLNSWAVQGRHQSLFADHPKGGLARRAHQANVAGGFTDRPAGGRPFNAAAPERHDRALAEAAEDLHARFFFFFEKNLSAPVLMVPAACPLLEHASESSLHPV